jgi:hypothetical protein
MVPTVTTTPLAEASAAPTGFDIAALIEEMFSAEPEPAEEVTTPTEPTALAAPIPAGPSDEGEISESIGDLVVAMPRMPRLGIWIAWAIAIVCVTAAVLAIDEMRRRKRS